MIFRDVELAEATGGTLVHPGPAGPASTDSRRLQAGDWFVTLSGDRFDGHDFLPMAQAARCAGAICERVPQGWDRGFVQVTDGLVALQDLARHVRRGFRGPVVGITGSAGKTTTRALIALVLEGRGTVHQTQGNLNNHIGVPLTLVHAPVGANAWVVEMGMSGPGEIDLLQDIAAPTIRVITNVGAAHLEGVGDLDGVARAKGELFDGARPGDVCIVNQDDPRVAGLPLPDGVRLIRYGTSQDCDIRLTDAVIEPTKLETRYRIQTPHGVVLGTLPGPGLHLAHNAAAAVAVGVALHVPTETMAARLSAYEPVGMRLRVEDGPGGLKIINDAYNANPISTAASLRTLAAIKGVRRVALLGDMLELGSVEGSAHTEILELAMSLDLDLVGTAGDLYAAAAQPPIVAASDAAGLARAVAPHLRPGDLVLLKGSRGMAMERVLQTLRETPPAGEEA